MDLIYKPDWEETKKRFEAFYQGEIIDRPCIHVTAPKQGERREHEPPQNQTDRERWLDFDQHIAWAEDYVRCTYWAGEAFPSSGMLPYLGPDQFAAFMGSSIHFAPGTSWVDHIIDDWQWFQPLVFNEANHWWRRWISAVEEAARCGRGKWIPSTGDIHSGGDCLLAMRGAEQLCMDLYERPDVIKRAMKELEVIWYNIYDQIYEACGGSESGTTGWLPSYAEGKFAIIQCDFNAMISPPMFNEFFLPELEAAADYLDHCVYHLDGPEAVPHLDALLSVKGIDAIQWVPGAAHPAPAKWIDLLKRIQKGGKAVWLQCTAEEAKQVSKELDPTRVFYHVSAVESEKEADDLIAWFRKNT